MSPYPPLPKGCVRLLRLLPPAGDKSRIECQLITCSLFDSRRTHSYEALSYVWGPEKSKKPIWINGNELSVRANLHTALSHLRDCFVERILWIDAICINQEDDIEKGHQVESMAKIYTQASRVIVWLGEAADDSNHALQTIRRAAEEQDANFWNHKTRQLINSKINNVNQQAVLTLLEREWFQRIWVLQEVAAARHVLVKCGHAEIDGYAFCLGLSVLRLSYEKRPHLQSLIPPIAYLIRGAVFRPRYEGDEISRQDKYSLNIRPLYELVDMYHTHKATFLLDKVYALLGMSNDDPYPAGLVPDYKAAWKDVFRELVQFCLSDQISVNTWDRAEAAVIEAKGYILGEVLSVGEDAAEHDRQNQDATWRDRQQVDIAWRNAPSYVDTEEKQNCRLTFQASAKAVKEGDIICLLQGASRPTIIRLCDDFSTIIIIAFSLADD
ncbi:heterokaryon incompatibility protein-domain-containing protein, partial [Immersiella caudata]